MLKDASLLEAHLGTMSLLMTSKKTHGGLKHSFKIKNHAGYMVHVDEAALEQIRSHPDVRKFRLGAISTT